ncbi:MAG TPA: hypothetical protein VF530_21675 [Planctomycetota bacterium]
MLDLAKIALALPDVEQGIACAGTALESRTYRTGKSAFLFVSAKDARLKLEASAAEARKLGFQVGTGGWVKLSLEALPAAAVLRRWVAESHALVHGSGKVRKEAGPAVAKGKRPPARRAARASTGSPAQRRVPGR